MMSQMSDIHLCDPATPCCNACDDADVAAVIGLAGKTADFGRSNIDAVEGNGDYTGQ